MRTGITTRVFSSPGTKITESYVKSFANTMRLRNVINFRTDRDLVSPAALRHDENEVEFPYFFPTIGIINHSLDSMIKQRLIPLVNDPADQAARPSQIFITPDSTLGAGLKVRINNWGKVNYLKS